MLEQGLQLKIIHAQDYIPDLQPICDALKAEGTTLHPSVQDLAQSYLRGQALVLMDDSKPVGFVRLIDHLNAQRRNALGLEGLVPEIYEIAGAIIMNDPAYRGKRLYPSLRLSLLDKFASQIKNNELLVVGASQTEKVMKVMQETNSRRQGPKFEPFAHGDFPLTSVFTCVCDPPFGTGFQLSQSCPVRLEGSPYNTGSNPVPLSLEELAVVIPKVSCGRSACIFYVSDEKLAVKTEDALAAKFATRSNLVDALFKINFYS